MTWPPVLSTKNNIFIPRDMGLFGNVLLKPQALSPYVADNSVFPRHFHMPHSMRVALLSQIGCISW